MATEVTDNLTPEEAYELQQFLQSQTKGLPRDGGVQNVHAFLREVAAAKDTTKTGFLTAEELGTPELPNRTFKELALFCDDIGNMGFFSDYFIKRSEILTSTSLSKEAKLLELAVISRRQLEDVTKPKKKENKGWFKKKDKGGNVDE
jgi:hypothetical protein